METDFVKNAVIEALDHHAKIKVTEETTDLTIEILCLDSLDVVYVIIEIEENLSIQLDDEILEDGKTTVAEFIETVQQLWDKKQ